MNKEEKNEKEFWRKIDRDNKIYQSNKALFFGGLLVVYFSYLFVKLCLNFSNYEEFKVAVRSYEKARSLGFLLAVAVGILFIWIGIKIRKSKISDSPRDLP